MTTTALPAHFSTDRLAALTRKIQSDITDNRIPGAVMLIAHKGQTVYEQALGQQDANNAVPMSMDSIFRIYSMTKPIVSVAIMMMAEEGRLLISDPVSMYLPEFKNLKVGVETTGADGQLRLELVPAQQEMTVQDLLRHTSGLTYGIFGESLVKAEYSRSGVERAGITNAGLVAGLGKLPLAYQPGTTWEYSRATDVLGALLERLSGQTLDVHLQERIFTPLRMHETAFSVPADQHHRIAEALDNDPDSGVPVRLLNVRTPPTFLSGGGGLTSTVHDYLRFATMMANEGELNGVRIVSRKTIRFMSCDHLAGMAEAKSGLNYLPGPGYGFGLGFAVRTTEGSGPTPGSVGDFNWSGLAGTYFWIDPKEQLVAIFLMQAPEQRNHYRQLFRNLVYAALP